MGVALLAFLHFSGGVLAFGAQFLLFANLEAIDESLRAVGLAPALLIIGMMFLAFLGIASGVGMWTGAKWGWWLGSFYYVYGIFRNGSALLNVVALADQLEDTARGPEYYMFKHGGRVLIHFLLFLYFFKGNVLRYFGLETLRKPKAIGIQVGICIAITMTTLGTSLLLDTFGVRNEDQARLDRIAVIYEQGDTTRAIEEMEDYLTTFPRDSLAWTILGNAYEDCDRLDEAQDAYESAIAIDPRQFQAITGLGIVHVARGDYDQAMQAFEKAIGINATYAQAYSSMTTIALKRHDDRKALEYARKGYAFDKSDPIIVANLALAYHYNNDFENRDKFTRLAEQMGYANVDALHQIYSGETTVRD